MARLGIDLVISSLLSYHRDGWSQILTNTWKQPVIIQVWKHLCWGSHVRNVRSFVRYFMSPINMETTIIFVALISHNVLVYSFVYPMMCTNRCISVNRVLVRSYEYIDKRIDYSDTICISIPRLITTKKSVNAVNGCLYAFLYMWIYSDSLGYVLKVAHIISFHQLTSYSRVVMGQSRHQLVRLLS